MRASRCSTRGRCAPSHALPISILMWVTTLIAGIALMVPSAPAVAQVDSTGDDGGFSVRVERDESDSDAAKRAADRAKRLQERAKERAARAAERAEGIEIPEPPEPPEAFHFSHDHEGEIVRFGEDVVIPADKTVNGDVVAIGGSVTVHGRVRGDCVALGGTVRVVGQGVVEGDAVSIGGGVMTSDSAVVGGSNVSVGSAGWGHGWKMLPFIGMMGAVGAGFGLAKILVGIVLMGFIAWLALLLLGDRISHASETLGRQFGKSFLYGLLGWIGLFLIVPVGVIALVVLSVIAIVILCITIIGIPLAVLWVVGLVLAILAICLGLVFGIFIAYVNGALFIGRRLLGDRGSTIGALLLATVLGFVVVAGLELVGELFGMVGFFMAQPLGIAFSVAADILAVVLSTAGLGAMILTRFGKRGEAFPGGASQWWPPSRPGTSPAPTTPPAPGAPPAPPAPSAPPPGTMGT